MLASPTIPWSFGILLALLSFSASAEPWLSNRMAQNCAGCHAPGRKNLAAKDRRCTLSCQGCHVNPNGGGMRSHYGKWTEDRWLKSFRSDMLEHRKAPATYSKQGYSRRPYQAADAKDKKKKTRRRKKPFRLVETNETYPDESKYDRRDGLEHIEASREEFQYQIPKEDPQFQMLQSKIDGGADFRWLMQDYEVETSSTGTTTKREGWHNFLMAADLALRYRPVYKRYHLVYEGRYFGSPTGSKKTQDVAKTLQRRSLYVLVDDLPYNVFAMGGYYRPMFENYTADHTALAQVQLAAALDAGKAYNIQYQAFTLGGSPNVPYANVTYLNGDYGATDNAKTKGLVVNLGGRFVTAGLSVKYSFWHLTSETDNAGQKAEPKVQMHAFGGGGQLSIVTWNLEALGILKDVPDQSFRKGLTLTLDTYTRLWRENYFVFNFATSNQATNLDPGTSNQLRLGVRSFVAPGVESQLLYGVENDERSETDDGLTASDTVKKEVQWLFHFYI